MFRCIRRGLQERQVNVGAEALNLPAKVVPVDSDIQAPDELLSAFLRAVRGLGQQDEAGAGAPYRLPKYSASVLACMYDFDSGFNLYLTNSRNGSSIPLLSATRLIVVLSPPGIMRASHFSSSAGVRTSMNVHDVAMSRDWRLAAAFLRS